MILQDCRLAETPDEIGDQSSLPRVGSSPPSIATISSVTNNMIRLRDKSVYTEVRGVLVDHLWERKGSEPHSE